VVFVPGNSAGPSYSGSVMTTQPIPTDRLYTGADSWLALAPHAGLGDHPLRVGLTENAIKGLRVISVESPRVRSIVEAGEACAYIWTSPLSMMPVYAPITGQVTIVNPNVHDDPTIVATDPMYGGWLYALLPVSSSSTDHLLTAGEYAQIMSPFFMLSFTASILSRSTYIAEKQKQDMLWQIVLFSLITLALLAGAWYHQPVYSLGLYTIAYCGMYLVYLWMCFKYSGGDRKITLEGGEVA